MEKSVQKAIEDITVRSKKFPEAPRPQTAHCIAPEIGGTNISVFGEFRIRTEIFSLCKQ